MKHVMAVLVGVFFAAALVGGCSDDDSVTQPQMGTLNLNINGLEDLGSTAVYEGWLIVGASPISTGTFTVDGSGTLSKTAFQLLKSNIDGATAFILTIEPVQ